MQLSRQWLDPNDGLKRISERTRVESDREPLDHATRFELPHSLGCAGRRQSNPAGEFAHGDAAVLRQNGEQFAVGLVEQDQSRRGRKAILQMSLRFEVKNVDVRAFYTWNRARDATRLIGPKPL